MEGGVNLLELRASKIGGCVRAYILDLRDPAEDVVTPRQQLYFDVGKCLEPVIMKHSGYHASMLFGDEVEVRVDLGNGLVLTGHPDSANGDLVIECKTMRSFAYRMMEKNGFKTQFPQYLMQGSVYCRGLDKAGVKYLCLDKDASHIKEIIVPWSTLEPYFEKAVANARTIHRWVDKKRLPGKDEALAPWYCSAAYCRHTDCRYHFVNRNERNKAWKSKKK